MTYTKPHSMLSFIYNTTGIGSFRGEMHADMRLAFERFELLDGAAQNACFGIEKAAYTLRTVCADAEACKPSDQKRFDQAKQEMKSASEALFKQLSIELTTMISAGGTQLAGDFPSEQLTGLRLVQSANGVQIESTSKTLLLDYVYWLVHFPQLSAALLHPNNGMERVLQKLPNPLKIKQAIVAIATALDNPQRAPTYANLRPEVDTLCEALAFEYSMWGWLVCW